MERTYTMNKPLGVAALTVAFFAFAPAGLFTNGGSIRIDYLPGRSHSTSFGVHLPIGQRWLGISRPRHDHVQLSDPEPPVIRFEPCDV